MVKTMAVLFGVVFLVVGILGFVPAVTKDDMLLGIFHVNAAHNCVHLLSGVVAPLAAKVHEIVSACGARIISGVRHSYVAGTQLLSLHASGRAVDIAGNPSCIHARLATWPGGASTDYARVRHVHISYAPGGREWGARFAHHIPKKHRRLRRA